jgi:glycosyltransferase involved in cell wall biosynthesis
LCSVDAGGQVGWFKKRLQSLIIDRYIAVSNEVRERLCKDLQVSEKKVRIVRNGIRLGIFDQPPDRALRRVLSGDSERPIIFTPARLHSQKGHIYLLQAAKELPEAVFVFAGDGPERHRLEEYARQIGVAGRVKFLGHRQDVPQLLANCDLFVLPSLYEGLPLSVLEAMAAGKPVIATAIGGTDEAVVDGVTGLLVRPGDSIGLAAAIRTLLQDGDLAARLADAGKRRVAEDFSSVAMVDRVTEVYDELFNGQSDAEPDSGSSKRLAARVSE